VFGLGMDYKKPANQCDSYPPQKEQIQLEKGKSKEFRKNTSAPFFVYLQTL